MNPIKNEDIDKMIEKHIMDYEIDIDLNKTVMNRIRKYEKRRNLFARFSQIMLSIITIVLSGVSILFFERNSAYFRSIINIFNLSFGFVRYSFLSLFIFLPAIVLLVIVIQVGVLSDKDEIDIIQESST